LLVNGVSAVVGVFLGNPFAPTIYIGHPGWKALGARAGYSVLNAIAITAILASCSGSASSSWRRRSRK
jgi:AGZA family xanthine/uracil permease-like MFS transporter